MGVGIRKLEACREQCLPFLDTWPTQETSSGLDNEPRNLPVGDMDALELLGHVGTGRALCLRLNRLRLSRALAVETSWQAHELKSCRRARNAGPPTTAHYVGRLAPDYDPWVGFEWPDRAASWNGRRARGDPRARRLRRTDSRVRTQSRVRRATAASASARAGWALRDSIRKKSSPQRSACSRAPTSMS